MKQRTAKTIPQAVQRVFDGRTWLSDGIREDLLHRITTDVGDAPGDPYQSLSDGELPVFGLIGKDQLKINCLKSRLLLLSTPTHCTVNTLSWTWMIEEHQFLDITRV